MRSGTRWTRWLCVALAHVAALAAWCSNARAQCSPDSLFTPAGAYPTDPLPRFMVAGDFNGDAVLDLAVSVPDAGTVSIFLGNGIPGAGDGTFRPGGSFDAGGPALGLVSDDFNGDGIRDLLVANGDAGTISVLLGQGTAGVGDGTFGAPSSYAVGSSLELVATGDFNGDGTPDLAVTDRSPRWIYVLLGQGTGGVGDGTFTVGFSTLLPNLPNGLAAADVNGDGVTDLVITTLSQAKLGVLLGRAGGIGDGMFAQPVYYSAGPSPSDLALRDFNADGRLVTPKYGTRVHVGSIIRTDLPLVADA